MKAVWSHGDHGTLIDDVLGWNLLCCLDECDKSCGLIHRCWLSPYIERQLTIDFNNL